MQGLKNVRFRRTDALTQLGWDQLESLLAEYYRRQGYKVEHCGTGATRARFDGGIDLKLRKDDSYVLVQCKHWNAKQVPHNDVHQLIGLMVNEGATGAILVTSGEFTRAAIEAATRQGHVQLVDGDGLRGMLGPLPEPSPASADRMRHGANASRAPRRRGVFASAMGAGPGLVLLKLLFCLVIVLILTNTLPTMVGSLVPGERGSTLQPAQQAPLPAPREVASGGVLQQMRPEPVRRPEAINHYTGTTIEDRSPTMPGYRQPTAGEIRESRLRADEAARIIEASTPEM